MSVVANPEAQRRLRDVRDRLADAQRGEPMRTGTCTRPSGTTTARPAWPGASRPTTGVKPQPPTSSASRTWKARSCTRWPA